jgi:hypothetical protein
MLRRTRYLIPLRYGRLVLSTGKFPNLGTVSNVEIHDIKCNNNRNTDVVANKVTTNRKFKSIGYYFDLTLLLLYLTVIFSIYAIVAMLFMWWIFDIFLCQCIFCNILN